MFDFTDDCLTGISEIDDEHRRLFKMINETQELLEQKDSVSLVSARDLIRALKNYAKTHFSHEEKYMREIHDLELHRQKREHACFIQKIDNYDIDSMDETRAGEAMEELLLFLSKWLYRHILGSDMMIGHNVSDSKGENPFAFTDEYKTGIDMVDEEHKVLFDIIGETNAVIQNELLHDKYDKIIDILEKLKEYTIQHFHDEEEYMERIRYEGLGAQRLAHEAFVEKLAEINLEDVDDNQQSYLEELIDFLLNWLITHILKMDKRIPNE